MATATPNLGLSIWDKGTDTYNHSQLANNFVKIDRHDHSPGLGNRIPESGLKDGAVSNVKIQDNAVTPNKIPNDSLTQDKLAEDSIGNSELQNASVATANIQDGAVTGAKLDGNIIPLGIIVPWFRRDSSVSIPNGWIACEGQPWSTIANDLGINSGNVPDLRNRFVLGATTGASGAGPDDAPNAGSTGGSNTANFNHAHSIGDHSHTVPNHAHGISVQPSHTHRFWSINYNTNASYLTEGAQRTTGVSSASASSGLQAFFVPGLNSGGRGSSDDGGVAAPMGPDEGPTHNHGGSTAGSGAITTSSAGAQNTTSALGNTDVRPRFIGLIHIMKVKI